MNVLLMVKILCILYMLLTVVMYVPVEFNMGS